MFAVYVQRLGTLDEFFSGSARPTLDDAISFALYRQLDAEAFVAALQLLALNGDEGAQRRLRAPHGYWWSEGAGALCL